MTKSLANKLYLKKKLYTFSMPAGRKISEHIDEFNKIVLDLANIEGKSRSKSRGGRLKCYICQSEDHLKRNCPKNNRKKSTGYVKKDGQPSSSGSIYDDSEMKDSVQLGDNRECKIRGIGKVRLQLKDGSSFVLHNVGELNQCLKKKRTVLRRRVWVYILRFKHEAFRKFKEWKQLVENQTGRTALQLRDSRQQNGVAERMNKTLMDKVRCLLIQSGLPKTFWAEATCTAAYLINRSPSRAIEKKTPMEMWSGHPNYQLARDRERRTRTKPLRFQDESNMAAYAFVAAEEEDTHEPLTYQ
ncbi:retrovirus-related pol polyprotein from transposon TNT 1-94 [Tanacetum coccineum]